MNVSKTIKRVALDADGYLVHFDEWDESVADTIAHREGIAGLTKDQRDALRFIHEHYRIPRNRS